MEEMIKAVETLIEACKKYNAGYMKVGLDEYSIFVCDKETTEFIENALEEEE